MSPTGPGCIGNRCGQSDGDRNDHCASPDTISLHWMRHPGNSRTPLPMLHQAVALRSDTRNRVRGQRDPQRAPTSSSINERLAVLALHSHVHMNSGTGAASSSVDTTASDTRDTSPTALTPCAPTPTRVARSDLRERPRHHDPTPLAAPESDPCPWQSQRGRSALDTGRTVVAVSRIHAHDNTVRERVRLLVDTDLVIRSLIAANVTSPNQIIEHSSPPRIGPGRRSALRPRLWSTPHWSCAEH